MDRQANGSAGGGQERPHWTVYFARFLLLFALVVGVLTYPVAANYEDSAKLIQLVKPSAESALFGDAGEPVGSPQLIVTKIPLEAVISGGDDSAGAPMVVDQTYLEKNHIYPVQLQTVQFVLQNVRLASWIACSVLFFILMGVQFRKRRRQGANPAMT